MCGRQLLAPLSNPFCSPTGEQRGTPGHSPAVDRDNRSGRRPARPDRDENDTVGRMVRGPKRRLHDGLRHERPSVLTSSHRGAVETVVICKAHSGRTVRDAVRTACQLATTAYRRQSTPERQRSTWEVQSNPATGPYKADKAAPVTRMNAAMIHMERMSER
jgi:hypothetical protein